MLFLGQTITQSPQPLHRSVSIIILPAICLFRLIIRFKGYKFRLASLSNRILTPPSAFVKEKGSGGRSLGIFSPKISQNVFVIPYYWSFQGLTSSCNFDCSIYKSRYLVVWQGVKLSDLRIIRLTFFFILNCVRKTKMNIFDKICIGVAFIMGVILLCLGVLGLFEGCNAHFSLPPLWGVIPAFVGWGIIRSVIVAWKSTA